MLRTGIPDLLDRSAGKSVRDTVDRVLAGSAGDYQRLDRVRSRRSGARRLCRDRAELRAGIDHRRGRTAVSMRSKHSMAQEIEHADISIRDDARDPRLSLPQ